MKDKFNGLFVPFSGLKTALRYERRERYYKILECMELRDENRKLREIVAEFHTLKNLVVETLVFDEGQITCPLNGNVPSWGGCCHSLSGNAGRTVVIIREENGTNDNGSRTGERGDRGGGVQYLELQP